MTRFSVELRKYVALGLACLGPVSPVMGQQSVSIAPIRPTGSIFTRPYRPVEVPAARLGDSGRLNGLVKAGKLYLTAQDAIALALENSIDVEVARYAPISSAWRVTRSEAGGALPGVPSGSSQTNSVASGQGVLGSQQATGVGGGSGNGSISRGGGNASISQVGPVTQNLDASLQGSVAFTHKSLPQPNNVQSATPILVQDGRVYSTSIQQGLLSGGSVTLAFNNNYLKENSPTNVLNPSNAARITLSFNHNLLRGFGLAVNARNITIARNNLKMSEANFRTQVIGVVVRVLNGYYSLVGAREDAGAKQNTFDVAETFLRDTKKQIEIGTLAGVEVIAAESQLATARLNLVNAQTTVKQQELALKNLISLTGVSDPVLASAEIIPMDKLSMPEKDELPAMKELVAQARSNRSDLVVQEANLKNSEISASGTKNGVLPSVQVFGSASQAGLAGTGKTVAGQVPPDPYFVGGLGTAVGQVMRRNYPSQSLGVFAQATIHNRVASADQAIDQLQLRQSELSVQKDLKQLQVDVMNAVVALQQARVRYEAAVMNRKLAKDLLDAEEKKFRLGASIPYNVIRQQRDLATAQASEVSTLITYNTARISLDRTLGTTLETNHISVADVLAGK